MPSYSKNEVVLVRYPFSALSGVKVRPAVLDFVEYLLSKEERNIPRHKSEEWSNLSLTLAMRGMENEETPPYTTADLKVSFR